METKYIYEIWGYLDAESPESPEIRETACRKAEAIKEGKRMSKEYPLVEVNRIEVDENENIMSDGECPQAMWKNGKRI